MSDDKKHDDTRTSSGEDLPFRCEICDACTRLNTVRRKMLAKVNACISRHEAVSDHDVQLWNSAVALNPCSNPQEDENVHVFELGDIDHTCPVCHGNEFEYKTDPIHHAEWWECTGCHKVIVEEGGHCDA